MRYFFQHQPVSWQPSADGSLLLGHMILLKGAGPPPSQLGPASTATLLGLKLVGGKLLPGNRIGAVVEKVKKGSVADNVGKLLPG